MLTLPITVKAFDCGLYNLLIKHFKDGESDPLNGKINIRLDNNFFLLPFRFICDGEYRYIFPHFKFVSEDLIIAFNSSEILIATNIGYGFKFNEFGLPSMPFCGIESFLEHNLEYYINKIIDAEIHIANSLSEFSHLAGSDIYRYCHDFILYGFGEGSMIREVLDCGGNPYYKYGFNTNDNRHFGEVLISSREMNSIRPMNPLLAKMDYSANSFARILALMRFVLDKVVNREYKISGIYNGIDIIRVKSAR